MGNMHNYWITAGSIFDDRRVRRRRIIYLPQRRESHKQKAVASATEEIQWSGSLLRRSRWTEKISGTRNEGMPYLFNTEYNPQTRPAIVTAAESDLALVMNSTARRAASSRLVTTSYVTGLLNWPARPTRPPTRATTPSSTHFAPCREGRTRRTGQTHLTTRLGWR